MRVADQQMINILTTGKNFLQVTMHVEAKEKEQIGKLPTYCRAYGNYIRRGLD
jgi:hypothetical protein